MMIETGWISILPPIIAIALALSTKEVYSSLFIGVLSGMVIYTLYAHEPFVAIFAHMFDMMAEKIADNSYMIIFLALLWAVITLVGKSGGMEAYGRWAGKKLKSRRMTQLATALLGVLIFIDDGFNCLTIGTVMRPIYDRQKISREKLAYIIDATAAPVCIIAPVSSWAVAVASEVSDTNGFHAFLSTIPYNLYALLTLVMVLFICITGKDFGKMKKAENNPSFIMESGDKENEKTNTPSGGHVYDLVLPIVILIICAILGMAYVGGFFSGVSFSEAIGYNPTAGLSLGAFAGLYDLCYCSTHVIFHGHILGDFRNPYTDRFDDLSGDRWGRYAYSGTWSHTCRVGIRRSLFSDFRHNDPVFDRSNVRPYKAC